MYVAKTTRGGIARHGVYVISGANDARRLSSGGLIIICCYFFLLLLLFHWRQFYLRAKIKESQFKCKQKKNQNSNNNRNLIRGKTTESPLIQAADLRAIDL